MNTITLKSGREKPTQRYHPWIFSGAIRSVSRGTKDGEIVTILSHRGGTLATGYYNSKSSIAVRVLDWGVETTDIEELVSARILSAIDMRQEILTGDSDSCRLIFSEGDGLPGLIADQYGDFLIVQFLTLGMDRLRKTVIQTLQQHLKPKGIYERSEGTNRKKEGLAPAYGVLAGVQPPDTLEIMIQGHRFLVDSLHGQKTGFYLDQAVNWKIIAEIAMGKTVLNCFSFTGAFGVFASAAGAREVTNIDTSAGALAMAEKNMSLNALSVAENIRADVFEQLRTYEKEGRQFDLIILDPPKLASSRRDLIPAARAYKDLNRIAMNILCDHGRLATFSCSEAMDSTLFDQVVWEASVESGIQMNRAMRLSQSGDHPVLLSFPEGHYLKGLLLQKR
ncbi:hypothetical protein AUK40_06445 [Candidatus Wirthbacteria bacterium CG2_30_54_11]|uniref:PUA domain-containing protein n=1 Tax=Candidatus Wirthbacteria bacterium CG2_30_54_11 TaxID=1817892 RepID=A0A1J5IPB5_9BACT|nr:MAG: hypothetical protein AUK40_06445 [Candidatus Wirthbacteria bacterium CG2_30_54_11]